MGGLLIIMHPYFDYVVSSVILANAVLIGVQTDIAAKAHHDAAQSPALRTIDIIFCLIFTFELAFRLSVYNIRFFYSSAWKWNCFDFLVVAIQLIEEATALAVPDSDSGATGLDFSFMRILRILRLVRIVRLVRIMRVIGELRMLVASISNSLRSLMWTIVLLFLCIYIVGVYFTAMIADHPSNELDEVSEMWGGLFIAMLTLFSCITGGMDWQDAVNPIMEHISPLLALPFVLFICFAVLAMMNVITGVFVESALASAKEDQDVFMVNNVRDMLKQEGDQPMTWEMFSQHLEKPQMLEYFRNIDVDISEARGLFMLLDMNDSGTLDTEEFLNGCIRLRGVAKSLDLALLTRQVKHMYEKMMEQTKALESQMMEQTTSLMRDQPPQPPIVSKGKGLTQDVKDEVKKMMNEVVNERVDNPKVNEDVEKRKATEKLRNENWTPPATFAPAPPNDFYPPALHVSEPQGQGYPFLDEC